MEKQLKKDKVFSPTKSINRANSVRSAWPKWRIESEGQFYTWNSKLERLNIIRTGVPYSTLDVISKRINMPIKNVLHLFDLPQTTYNKKRREKSMLSGRDSEVVLMLTELIDFGIDTFNNEEPKFLRWMKKQNAALGNNTPESLLDSITGIQEVKNCLNRIEFGNLA